MSGSAARPEGGDRRIISNRVCRHNRCPRRPVPGAGVRYYNHMPAERIRELVGPRIWDEYFTFCFERNPWDKAVSLYFHRYRVEPRPSFMQFVASGEVADAVNYPLYHDGQRLLVDHIARYEQMSTETDYLFRRLQLPQPLSLLKAKSQFRQGDGSALMDGWSAAAIAEIFADELSLFGYRPPSWVGAADQRTPLPVRALEVHRAAN